MNKLNFSDRLNSLKNAPVTVRKISKRAEILELFLNRLNSERGSYPPLNPARVGKLLRYIETENLFSFFKECEYQKNFSSYFFWATNPKKHNPQAK